MEGSYVPNKRRHVASSEVFEVSLRMLAFERDRFEVGDYRLDSRSIALLKDRASIALFMLKEASFMLSPSKHQASESMRPPTQSESAARLAAGEARRIGGVRRAVRKKKRAAVTLKTAAEHERELSERFKPMKLESDKYLAECKRQPNMESSAIDLMRKDYPNVIFQPVESLAQLRPGFLVWYKPVATINPKCMCTQKLEHRKAFHLGVVANPCHPDAPDRAEICMIVTEADREIDDHCFPIGKKYKAARPPFNGQLKLADGMTMPEKGTHYICANFNMPTHISHLWAIEDAASMKRFRLDEESFEDLFIAQLLARVGYRLDRAGQAEWLLEAMARSFPQGWYDGVLVCKTMIKPFGPMPEPTEPNIQFAFRELLLVAWMWHLVYQNTRENGPTELLRPSIEVTVELKRAVQAAKALGAKEEDIKEPDPDLAPLGLQKIVGVAFMWSIMGPGMKEVVQHLRNAFKTAQKHAPKVDVDEDWNVIQGVVELGLGEHDSTEARGEEA